MWKHQAAAFVLSMLKINAAAWRSRRPYSVSTALLAFAQRAPRRSAFFKRCWNAVRTPLWCDRGLRSAKMFVKQACVYIFNTRTKLIDQYRREMAGNRLRSRMFVEKALCLYIQYTH